MKQITRKTALLLALVLLLGSVSMAGAEGAEIVQPDFAALIAAGEQESVPGVILRTETKFFAAYIGQFCGRYAAYQDAVTGCWGVIDCDGRILWQPKDPEIMMIEPFENGIVMALREDVGWQPFTVTGKPIAMDGFEIGEFSARQDRSTGKAAYVCGEIRKGDGEEPYGGCAIDGNGRCITAQDIGLIYDGVLPVKQNGKYCLRDFAGNTLLPYAYDELRFVDADTLLAKQGGAYRLIDRGGNTVAALPNCTEAVSMAPYAACVMVKEDGLWGVRGADGAQLLPCKYAEMDWSASITDPLGDGVHFKALADDGWHQLSPDGRMDILVCARDAADIDYCWAWALTETLYVHRSGGLAYEIVDAKGAPLIEGVYRGYAFRNGYLVLEDARTKALTVYDTERNKLFECEPADWFSVVGESLLCWRSNAMVFYSLSDGAVKSALEGIGWASAGHYDEYSLVVSKRDYSMPNESSYALTDTEGSLQTELCFETWSFAANGIWQMRRGGTWYIVDCLGRELTAMDEEARFNVPESPYAAYMVDGKYGFLQYRGAGEPLFADISAGDWFAAGVDFCAKAGLMKGVGGGKFAPQTVMTRAMLVQVLYNLSGEKCAAFGFEDVAAGAWYADAVNWAAANGIVTGKSATRFAPNEPVTREQMVTILRRYALHFGEAEGAADALDAFADAGSVSPYAEDAMRWAVSTGLINGVSADEVRPGGQATRAQVATILMRFVRSMADPED